MISDPVERQFAYLRAHPDVTVLGTQLQAIDWETKQATITNRASGARSRTNSSSIIRDTSEIWFLNHPTVMLRPREVMNLGGYPSYRVAQDLGLWLKVAQAGLKIHNLPTVRVAHPVASQSSLGSQRR
jgi:amylovoran biosynthesis glycosyltransferase AmsE